MKCTHCGHVNEPKATHCAECDVYLSRKKQFDGKASPYRIGVQVGTEWIDKQCSWNDHGHRCESQGWMSQSTNGSGPWFCGRHFDELRTSGPLVAVSPEQHAEWVDDVKLLIKSKTLEAA